MDEQRQDNQLKPIYNRSVPIRNVALKTYWERWTIETSGGRGPVRSDNDNIDDECYIAIHENI